ncbi:MAG: hypothetical protein LC730_06100 [Acidobacteria bacterium]|nr:hypothetical protein [Acidobacteriota bacterium]MCA1609012.1 hypothetical protein [Acidobacteriota bacterium]
MLKHWEDFCIPFDSKQVMRPRVSLSPKGIISINRIAFEMLGEPEAVILMFDRINSLIGLRPGPTKFEHAFPLVSPNKSGLGKIVRGKKFCNYYQIFLDHTIVFNRLTKEGDILVLSLKDAMEYRRPAVADR